MIHVTMTARLVADPEVRFTQAGKAVASLRLASNQRRYNQQAQQWEDGETTFINASLFGAKAEAVAEQLRKGQLLTAIGKLRASEWKDRDGNTRTSYEVVVDEVAATITGGQTRPAPSQPSQWQASTAQVAGDPWAGQQTEAPF